MDSVPLRPNRKRVLVFFVSCFVAVAAPTLVPWIAVWLGPPAYAVNEEALTGRWLRAVAFPGEVTVTTTRHPNAEAARQSAKDLLKTVPVQSLTEMLQVFRYSRSDNGKRSLVVPIQNVLVRLEGPDRVSLEEALKSLPFITFNPNSPVSWLTRLFTEHLGAFLAGLAAYAVFCAVILSRRGSWAGRISPPAGTAHVTAEEMRSRILGINGLGVPFCIREGRRGYLIAEWWLADAKWTTVMEQAGLSMTHSVKMKLDPARSRVKATDYFKSVRWARGLPSLRWSCHVFRGIDFGGFETEASYGLLYKDGGWRFDRAYQYSYDLDEIKAPLVKAVVTGGWTYQPVLTFLPLLGS